MNIELNMTFVSILLVKTFFIFMEPKSDFFVTFMIFNTDKKLLKVGKYVNATHEYVLWDFLLHWSRCGKALLNSSYCKMSLLSKHSHAFFFFLIKIFIKSILQRLKLAKTKTFVFIKKS